MQQLESYSENESHDVTIEKSPQDMSLEEGFDIIIACSTLAEQGVSELCLKKGL
ncbi:MAG: hypothetical protein ACJAUP_002645 [Cellvibrionaceae bacterium]